MSKQSYNGEKGRFSSKRKVEAVLRLLRGEDLDTLSRALGVTAARLSQWREEFLEGGQAHLKSRAGDGREEALARLRAKVGELTMDLEASREAVRRLKADVPWVSRKSKS